MARPQAAHRPPRKDYVEVDVAAGTGGYVAKVLLTSERETPRSYRPSPWPALASSGGTPFVTSHSHCPSRWADGGNGQDARRRTGRDRSQLERHRRHGG